MLKKALFAGGGLLLLMGLFLGRDAYSYVSTTLGWVHDSVKESVPIEFEMKRARQLIKELEPEIEKNMARIAREEVEVEKLQGKIENSEQQLAQSKSEILRLSADLKSGSEVFVYAGRDYSRDQVRLDLKRRFENFKTKEAETTHWKDVLAARQNTLVAAQEKLESMRAAKSNLEVEVERLEARLQMVHVAQAKSEFKFDDSKLSRAKALLDEIDTRIDVAAKLVDADKNYPEQIPVEQDVESDGDIAEEVTNYFGGGEEIDVNGLVRIN